MAYPDHKGQGKQNMTGEESDLPGSLATNEPSGQPQTENAEVANIGSCMPGLAHLRLRQNEGLAENLSNDAIYEDLCTPGSAQCRLKRWPSRIF